MLEAAFWGLVGGIALVIGLAVRVPKRAPLALDGRRHDARIRARGAADDALKTRLRRSVKTPEPADDGVTAASKT